jgi:thiol-disulfide isomerase/thioredoxin
MPRRALYLALTAAALATGASPAAHAGKIVVGKPAPNFKAVTFDGQPVSLESYKGQVLIINFWATWCGPCRQELPLLDAAVKVEGKYGFDVLAVTDENSVPLTKLKPLAKALTLKMAWRFSGPYDRPNVFPTNYIIDRQGIVRYAAPGAFSLDALNAVLGPLLKEEPPSTDKSAADSAPAVETTP